MYIIKVKGKAKIPDYIQLRDEEFILVAYFRADRPLKDLHRYGLEGKGGGAGRGNFRPGIWQIAALGYLKGEAV